MSLASMPPGKGVDQKARIAVRCVPIDSTDTLFLNEEVAGIWCGSDGNITLEDRAGNAFVFTNCRAGTILPVATVKVRTTGTTVTGMVGLI